jgi:hypothetical protein
LRGLICLIALAALLGSAGPSRSADHTFNITKVAGGEANPFPPSGSNFSYADVWSENGYVYLGSDRSGRGTAILSISNSGVPTYLTQYDGIGGDGSEYEDVEVWDGIGYFSADVSPSTAGTGVDIVDLSIPFDPLHKGRVNSLDCLNGSPSVCGHNKVHTLSIQRLNPDTPSEMRYLYTTDNETDTIKISDVSVLESPSLIASVDLGLASNYGSHEVVVRNNRMYVATKICPGCSGSGNGWFHIYDVSNPSSPVRLKAFQTTTASTHTAMPTEDGNYLITAEERTNGSVKIYNISNINSPNDPDTPTLVKTFNRTNVCVSAGNCLDAHSPHHIHTFGNLMFMPWYESGLTVFNISNPADPKWVGAYDTFTGTSTNFNGNWGVDLSRGLSQVLISDRSRGLIVLDARSVVLPGDYNQDMVVNDLDYNVWKASYGTTESGAHNLAWADGNYDGKVDGADYIIWRNNYGQVQTGISLTGAGAAVPEPTALFLFGAGILMIASRRYRQS